MELDFRAILAEERKKAASKQSGATEKAPLQDEIRTTVSDDDTDYQSLEACSFLQIDTLLQFKLNCEYESIYYVPYYIDESTEAVILSCVDKAPWTILRTRRLQCYDSFQQPLPTYLQNINNSLVANDVFGVMHQPNHILINDYRSDEVTYTDLNRSVTYRTLVHLLIIIIGYTASRRWTLLLPQSGNLIDAVAVFDDV